MRGATVASKMSRYIPMLHEDELLQIDYWAAHDLAIPHFVKKETAKECKDKRVTRIFLSGDPASTAEIKGLLSYKHFKDTAEDLKPMYNIKYVAKLTERLKEDDGTHYVQLDYNRNTDTAIGQYLKKGDRMIYESENIEYITNLTDVWTPEDLLTYIRWATTDKEVTHEIRKI